MQFVYLGALIGQRERENRSVSVNVIQKELNIEGNKRASGSDGG